MNMSRKSRAVLYFLILTAIYIIHLILGGPGSTLFVYATITWASTSVMLLLYFAGVIKWLGKPPE